VTAASGALSIGRSGYSADEFVDAVTNKYQSLYDQGYAMAQKAADNGLIRDTNLAKGNQTDGFARAGLRDWLKSENIPEGPGEIIQVNRRLYDPSGSGAYRIPDVYIPSSQTILDGSLTFEEADFAQILDFTEFSGGARTTIIAPAGAGLKWGSYTIYR